MGLTVAGLNRESLAPEPHAVFLKELVNSNGSLEGRELHLRSLHWTQLPLKVFTTQRALAVRGGIPADITQRIKMTSASFPVGSSLSAHVNCVLGPGSPLSDGAALMLSAFWERKWGPEWCISWFGIFCGCLPTTPTLGNSLSKRSLLRLLWKNTTKLLCMEQEFMFLETMNGVTQPLLRFLPDEDSVCGFLSWAV